MPGLTKPRHRLGTIAAVLTAFALSLLFIVPVASASAAPAAPSAAVVVAQAAPAATATATTPLSTHCAKKLRWKTAYKGQDADLKFRVWSYTTKAHNRYFCYKVYKMRSSDKTLIGAIVTPPSGAKYHVTTRSSSFWARIKLAKGKRAYVQAHYGNEYYQTMVLKGYGVK